MRIKSTLHSPSANKYRASRAIACDFVIFTARRRYAKRGICRRRVSVCLSVTLRYIIKMAKRRITQITPHGSPMTLVF